jgi:hypothetical protein
VTSLFCLIPTCSDFEFCESGIQSAIAETVDQSSFGLLEEGLQEALQRRNLPVDSPIAPLADCFAAVMAGMAVMAKLGVTQQRLFDTIERALWVLEGQADNETAGDRRA